MIKYYAILSYLWNSFNFFSLFYRITIKNFYKCAHTISILETIIKININDQCGEKKKETLNLQKLNICFIKSNLFNVMYRTWKVYWLAVKRAFFHFLSFNNNFFVCRFSLDRHTDLDRIFNIHSGNGSIYTSKPLDREISQWHNLSVIAAEISKPIWSFFHSVFLSLQSYSCGSMQKKKKNNNNEKKTTSFLPPNSVRYSWKLNWGNR